MKIFDVHIHIYPEKIAEKASQSICEFYDDYLLSGNGTLQDCVARLEAAGIRRFAAHSVALLPRNVAAINRFLLAARDLYPDRILPFAALHPDLEDLSSAVAEMAEQGFYGFKIHPDMQRFPLDSDRSVYMLEVAADTGLPVLVHCGDPRLDYDGPKRVLALHKRLPHLKLICAHLGGWMEWDEACDLLADCGLIFDLSSSLYKLPPERAVEIIRRFGAKNILYGTDYPKWEPQVELDRFLSIDLTEEERADILWNNANRLFKLE